jgi:TolB protein
MNPDGTGQVRLTNHPATDRAPAWHPSAPKIAFSTDRDGDVEIYVMNADGSGQTRLTHSPGVDDFPSWSPDGSKIIFQTNRDGNYEIYAMNADGSGATRLTHHPAEDSGIPAYSPDGTRFAWATNRDGNFEIYSAAADGSGPTRLTNAPRQDALPDWSPDGAKIAFRVDLGFGAGWGEVFVMNTDGSGQVNLTNTATVFESTGGYSPDGTKIVFLANATGTNDIYVMNADGSGRVQITNTPGVSELEPRWQPLPASADVTIDVKPDSEPNAVNPRSRGVIPVAVLTTSVAAGDLVDFDALSVDPASLAFGPGAAGIAHAGAHAEDVDGDGDLDLLAHFRTAEVGTACGDTEVHLSGETFGGDAIEGFDSVRTVGCR